MDDLLDIAEFTSASLSPRLPEACQVNPQVYGAELAYWLGAQLARRGITTSYPESEDWGWYIEYGSANGAEFAVHYGNVDGSPERWFLQLRRFGRKLFGRDKPPYSEAAGLVTGIKTVLESEASVTALEWHYPRDDAA